VEVLRRDGKLLVVLVRVDAPVSFYQVLGIQTHRLNERLGKYLQNALQARKASPDGAITGRIFLMGFLEKPDFELFKSALKEKVGYEGQALLQEKLSSLAPAHQVAFQFAMAGRVFTETVMDESISELGVSDLVKHFSTLVPQHWITEGEN
jgi:hypothetical protein